MKLRSAVVARMNANSDSGESLARYHKLTDSIITEVRQQIEKIEDLIASGFHESSRMRRDDPANSQHRSYEEALEALYDSLRILRGETDGDVAVVAATRKRYSFDELEQNEVIDARFGHASGGDSQELLNEWLFGLGWENDVRKAHLFIPLQGVDFKKLSTDFIQSDPNTATDRSLQKLRELAACQEFPTAEQGNYADVSPPATPGIHSAGVIRVTGLPMIYTVDNCGRVTQAVSQAVVGHQSDPKCNVAQYWKTVYAADFGAEFTGSGEWTAGHIIAASLAPEFSGVDKNKSFANVNNLNFLKDEFPMDLEKLVHRTMPKK